MPSFRWVTKLISDPHEEVFERKVAAKLNDNWNPIGGAYYSRGVHFLLMAKHQLGEENAA